jgi:hypothetical protein
MPTASNYGEEPQRTPFPQPIQFGIDLPDSRSEATDNLFAGSFLGEPFREIEHLRRHLLIILRHTISTTSCTDQEINESVEELFASYEGRNDIFHLERVLAISLFMFGSESQLFFDHVRRFCHAALQRPPSTTQSNTILLQALLITLGLSQTRNYSANSEAG